MGSRILPSVIKAWQFSSTEGGLEKNLKINSSIPLPKPKSNQNLVRVIATALNPIDCKAAEIPLIGRFLVPRPATPGNDFAGCIITPSPGSSFKQGQLVFGVASNATGAGGALSEFIVPESAIIAAVPDGVDPVDAATVGIAGLIAYQSIVPNVKKGDKVFINGGSGGTGVFGIQIAKAVGCHVTTTCSTVNVELCKSLGADEVVDYKTSNVVEVLKASGNKFNFIVDNVGSDPQLYWHCHEYTTPKALYVMVAVSPSLEFFSNLLKQMIWPSFLGGGKRKMAVFVAKPKAADLEEIGRWMEEGKVRAVIDTTFAFEEAPKAFERLKTGRAKGKIVVDVASETYKTWTE